jgi:putative hydrolase of the HAD superfamily
MQDMPLLLFDLDNTLLPRDAAFRAWARDFLAEHRLPAGDIDWFTTIDGSGYVPRSTVLGAAKRRYGLDHSLDLLLAHYRRGINAHIHCPTPHIDALHAARASGWTLGIVSNGGTRPQLEKIRRTGLGPLVDGWVISEEAGCVKPDPLIFEIAAQRCGLQASSGWESDTWVIGDHAPADIAGAEVAGLRSVWLHHGRPWAESGYRPTLSAAGLPEAVGLALSARSAPSAATVRRATAARTEAHHGHERGREHEHGHRHGQAQGQVQGQVQGQGQAVRHAEAHSAARYNPTGHPTVNPSSAAAAWGRLPGASKESSRNEPVTPLRSTATPATAAAATITGTAAATAPATVGHHQTVPHESAAHRSAV